MNDGPGPKIRLRRNRLIGAVAAILFLGVGTIILVAALRPPIRPFGFLLALVLIVPGAWAVPLMLRPWRLDGQGVRLGTRRILTWDQVGAVEVRDIRPIGAGRGPAHVTVILRSVDARVALALYSRREAESVAALLAEVLPSHVAGRSGLPRIAEAWTGLS